MTAPTFGERKLVGRVRAGEWEIDEQGVIWRLGVRRWFVNHTQFVPCARRCAEWLERSGYRSVQSMIDGVKYRAYSHRVVWQFHHGDIPEGVEINHINGIKIDNRPENLELVTQSQNRYHAQEHGLVSAPSGETHYRSQLSDKAISDLRRRYADGESAQALAFEYRIACVQVYRLARGVVRASAPGPITVRRPLRKPDAQTS